VLLFVCLLLPVVAIMHLTMESVALHFIVAQAVNSAARSESYYQALNNANKILCDAINSPLATLCGISHKEVKQIELYVIEHDVTSGERRVFGPDKPLSKTILPSVNTYEYEVCLSYRLEPLLPSCRSVLGRVLLLSEPAIATVSATRAAEFPHGVCVLPVHDLSHINW
jgi:hypothetical protein